MAGQNNLKSKTERMHFLAYNNKYQEADTTNIQVRDRCVSFKKVFKHLGLLITSELNDDEIDVEARIMQANKAMGVLWSYFKYKQR
jgi:hypothetical protein